MNSKESGGSQPHLFAADDQLNYMVKASNNPQGLTCVINELICGQLMGWLGVRHPAPALIELPQLLLDATPNAMFSNNQKLASGPAFGSEFWDSEPQNTLAAGVFGNMEDIAGTMVFDTWIANHDSRQYRERQCPANPKAFEFVPLDHGHSIGPNWTPASIAPANETITVKDPVAPVSVLQVLPFTERLRSFQKAVAEEVVERVPQSWLSNVYRIAVIDYVTRRAPLAADAIDVKYPQLVPP